MQRINNQFKISQIQERILDISIQVSLHPSKFEMLTYRAILYDALKDYENAIDDLNMVLSQCPNSIDALYVKADIALETGDCHELSSTLVKIISLESIDIDLINTNFLQFFKLLIKKRKANIAQKITSTINYNTLKSNYGFNETTTWN